MGKMAAMRNTPRPAHEKALRVGIEPRHYWLMSGRGDEKGDLDLENCLSDRLQRET
jgi:hypothetical protein